MKPKVINLVLGTKGQTGTLICDDIKGKIARDVSVSQGDGTIDVGIHFEDETECQVELDSSPVVRVSLLTDNGEGEDEELAASATIPIPQIH